MVIDTRYRSDRFHARAKRLHAAGLCVQCQAETTCWRCDRCRQHNKQARAIRRADRRDIINAQNLASYYRRKEQIAA